MPEPDDSPDVNCYRKKFTGHYKTFSSDPNTVQTRWILIHPGPCQCEGKTPVDCIEPGDNQ